MKKKRNYIGLVFTGAVTVLLGVLKSVGVLTWNWFEIAIPFGLGFTVWLIDLLIRYFELKALKARTQSGVNRNFDLSNFEPEKEYETLQKQYETKPGVKFNDKINLSDYKAAGISVATDTDEHKAMDIKLQIAHEDLNKLRGIDVVAELEKTLIEELSKSKKK